jgi:drug/metabolite transporter (DMT)-like permease
MGACSTGASPEVDALQPGTPLKPSVHGNLWMLCAGFFFACMGALVKIGSYTFSITELVFYRSLFGLLVIVLITRFGQKSLGTKYLKLHLSRSLLGLVTLALFFYAISKLPLATAVTLNYTSPLFLAVLAMFFLRGEAKPILLFAIAIGFGGVALLLQPSFSSDDWPAALLGLLSGLLAGIVYLQVTQLGRIGEPEWRTVFYFTLVCTIGSGLWMLVHAIHSLTLPDLLLLSAMGACATLAQLAMTRAYRKGDPLIAGSLAYSTVVLASLLGILLWGETLSAEGWLGVGLIVLSGVISLGNTPLRRSAEHFDKNAQAPTL